MRSPRRIGAVAAALAVGAFGVGVVALRSGPARTLPARIRWAALGDSYSAGVGGTGLVKGLLSSIDRSCAQDESAYAVQASHAVADRLDRFDFVACTGATTRDVSGRQLDALRPDTNVVTLTIGGNDVGVGSLFPQCLEQRCPDWFLALDQQPPLDPEPGDTGGSSFEILAGRLARQYADIRRRMQPDGDLYVLAYPLPFGDVDGMGRALRVGGVFSGFACSGMTVEAADAANRLALRLDDTIRAAVRTADRSAGRVHFVDWKTVERGESRVLRRRTAWSPNGVCGDPGETAWINSAHTLFPNFFHPSSTGYWEGAKRLLASMGAPAGGPGFTPETVPPRERQSRT